MLRFAIALLIRRGDDMALRDFYRYDRDACALFRCYLMPPMPCRHDVMPMPLERAAFRLDSIRLC